MDKLTEKDILDIVKASGVNTLQEGNSIAEEEPKTPSVNGKKEKRINPDDVNYITTLRLFMKKNSGVLYTLLALFILTEGIALSKFTNYWWIPLIAMLALTAITFVWLTSKVIVKAMISLAALVVTASFQMLFATAFSTVPVQAMIVPASTVCAFFVFICISYLIDTNVSRWMAAIDGCVMAFIASYVFISYGLIPSSIAGIAGMIIGGIAWMLMKNAWQRRTGTMPARPRTLDSNKTIAIRDAMKNDYDFVSYDKCRYPFYVLLPKEDNADNDNRVIVIQPLDFKTNLVSSAKRGLIYHYRKVGEYFYRVASYCRSRVDSNAIILFGDTTGTLTTHEIVGIDMADSAHAYNVGIVDISTGRRRMREDINAMIARFDYPDASDRTLRRIRKIAS